MRTTEETAYDLLGRVTRKTDVLGRVTTTSYSEDGLTATTTTPSGATLVNTYNTDGKTAPACLRKGMEDFILKAGMGRLPEFAGKFRFPSVGGTIEGNAALSGSDGVYPPPCPAFRKRHGKEFKPSPARLALAYGRFLSLTKPKGWTKEPRPHGSCANGRKKKEPCRSLL
ncbi:RHS repeat protein [Akkermansia muciniphila]|uniref:RHS repeat domain-containing protein n=1 Tax=Akkermansia muciniphila TaxID=239935 RepID=UPI0016039149|nr:RHS repeat domain-containing protein [Akkermansia muciniphila]QNB44728.1 RHS repeat protein [Akkermansia muciniphila]